ncbi:hypothetical protein CO614_07960 [Lysobacteraceae bacterium NML120232]|nr:hypothetical protein CO608_04665 [Xanthomonadaceae bacterium NML08-0793]PJK10723.1 hypothetical protein CO614_07960 [Xanthomonadaceae bacterium NML120232]
MNEAGFGRTGTRALLEKLTGGEPDEVLELGNLLGGLGRRAFGVLLFLAIPPAFFPGVAAVIAAPATVLVGLHLLLLRQHVWLPRFLAERGPERQLISRFEQRFDRWFQRLERWAKPRWLLLIDHPAATMFTGLMLVLLGILLALPIPFTNALFALLLLPIALGLLERDGRLLLFGWVCGCIAISSFGLLSGELFALVGKIFRL